MRGASSLFVYDTRYLYESHNPFQFNILAKSDRSLVAQLARDTSTTHQRLQFDIDANGECIAAGDQHGNIRIWSWSTILDQKENRYIHPIAEWHAHNGKFFINMGSHTDAVGSVQFCPNDIHTLVSVGGARHWDKESTISTGPVPSDRDAKIWNWTAKEHRVGEQTK